MTRDAIRLAVTKHTQEEDELDPVTVPLRYVTILCRVTHTDTHTHTQEDDWTLSLCR